jgi:hypothetical protein
VTSRGRGKGEKRWSDGGVWTRVEGHPVRDFGDGRVGGGGAVGDKVGVGEGGVPTGGKGCAVVQVARVGLEEGLGAGLGDEARPKVGVQESSAHEVGAFKGGGRARGSGVGDRREKSGVFEGKEGIGKMRKGLANARETGGGEEDIKTTVVVRGRGEIETPSAMLGPRLAGEGRVESDDKLAGGMDGMGGKVVGGTMEIMVGGERGVERPGSEVVKGELGLWEQVVPAVRREGDVGGREDGDKMVFGGTNCSFHRVGAMVKGRNVLEGEVDREE